MSTTIFEEKLVLKLKNNFKNHVNFYYYYCAIQEVQKNVQVMLMKLLAD